MRATDSHPDRLSCATRPEQAWLAGWLMCVVILIALPAWQVVPLDAAWIGLAVLYGLRIRPNARLLALTAMAAAVTAAAVSADWIEKVRIVGGPVSQIPLLAAIVVVMAWQARRWVIADDCAVADELDRLRALDDQLLLILAAADADLPSSRCMLDELLCLPGGTLGRPGDTPEPPMAPSAPLNLANLTTSMPQPSNRKDGPA